MTLKHSVYDSDTHFSINPITRAIKNESTTKTGLIQYDHNSERFTFEIPKVIEGHDMSQCDVIEVHYINVSADKTEQSADVYIVDDMQVDESDDDVVIFSWLISQNATRYVGSLNFIVRFACTDEADSTKIIYAWHTAVNSDISVSSGICNTESVVEQYSDLLEVWRKEIDTFRIMDLRQTTTSNVSGGENIWTATIGTGKHEQKIHLRVLNGKAGGQGKEGKSAYEIAKEHDNSIGSEAEWTAGLRAAEFYSEGTKLNKVVFSHEGTTLKITTS